MTARPQLKADVIRAALMIDGRTLIPAASKAITNGLCCAVPLEVPKFGSFEGLSRSEIRYVAEHAWR